MRVTVNQTKYSIESLTSPGSLWLMNMEGREIISRQDTIPVSCPGIHSSQCRHNDEVPIKTPFHSSRNEIIGAASRRSLRGPVHQNRSSSFP